MIEYSQQEIKTALDEIEKMEHYEMCKLWRFTKGESIYFRNDLPTSVAFKDRLFKHFGGFTPAISKSLGFKNINQRR